MMRTQEQLPSVPLRRVAIKWRRLTDEAASYFDEQELKVRGAGDEKLTPAEN